MSTFIVSRLHSLVSSAFREPLWDIALPLEEGKVHERTRVLAIGPEQAADARAVTPLVDLDVPAQNLNPSTTSGGNWERSEHRFGPFKKDFKDGNFPTLRCKAARIHVKASHEVKDKKLFFSGQGWIDYGTRLQLEAGELPIEARHGTYVHDVFAPLLADGSLDLRLLPNAIGLRAKRLPLWTDGAHALQDVSVWLERDAGQGLWLRLDPDVDVPDESLLVEQCNVLEILLAQSAQGPHWSALRTARRLDARDLRWPISVGAKSLTLDQPADAGVRLGLAPGSLHVVLQDQRARGALPVLSTAQLEVERAQVELRATGATLTLGAGATTGAAHASYAFALPAVEGASSTESLKVMTSVAFRVARGLRARMADIRSGTGPLQRVFLALEDGWLQVPAERLDPHEPVPAPAPAAVDGENPESSTSRVGGLSGEWQLGTRRSEIVAQGSVLQMPWSVSMRHAGGFSGSWTYAGPADEWPLRSVDVDLFETQAEIRGLLWAAVGQATDEDLLPQLALGSRHLRDLILLQGATKNGASLAFESDLVVHREDSGWPRIVPASFRLRWAPLGNDSEAVVSWSAHPRLPAMLVMPVTSNRAAPQRALASRELQPLPLQDAELTFTHRATKPWPALDSSALRDPAGWPQPAFAKPAPNDPAIAWEGPAPHDGLPLLALSLAGVELWPGTHTGERQFAYRCDLPVMDEFFARARAPQPPRQRSAVLAIGAVAAESEAVADLAVATTQDISQHFVSHHDAWCLSRGEGIEFRSPTGQMIRHHLVGGWAWTRGKIDLHDSIQINWTGGAGPTSFGTVEVTDTAGGAHPAFGWRASGDAALAGPSAGLAFSGNHVALIAQGNDVVGWSVAAFEQGGLTWDTRGLGRGRAERGAELHTRAWQGRDATLGTTDLELKTLVEPLRLAVGRPGGPSWCLWFRALPFKNAAFPPPDLDERWRPVLDGFEWRVWPESEDDAHWRLEPRELLAVTCSATRVESLRLRAGVALPQRHGASAAISEVELTFERSGDVLLLARASHGWFELPLATLATTYEAAPLLQAKLDYDANVRDLALKDVTLSMGLLGATRDLATKASVPLALPQTIEFTPVDLVTVDTDTAQLRGLVLIVGPRPLDDNFALEFHLSAAPIGEIALTQQWKADGPGKAQVARWRWLEEWNNPDLTPQLDLRRHAGFCIAGRRKWDGDLTLLPHWTVAQPTATVTFACAIGDERTSPKLHSAIVEMSLFSEATRVSQHSVLASGKWGHRVRVSGEWSLPCVHQWPSVTRQNNQPTLSSPMATQITRLRFEDTELAPSKLVIRPRLGLHLELHQDVFLRASHEFTRAGVTKKVDVLSPFWIGPMESFIEQLEEQGSRATLGLKSGNKDNLIAALSSTSAGLAAADVVADLKHWAAQAQLDDALCVIGACVASVDAAGIHNTVVLPALWIDDPAVTLPASLAGRLRPQGTLKSALAFDDLLAAPSGGGPLELVAVTSHHLTVSSDPAPIWEVRREPPAATHAIVKNLLTGPPFFVTAQSQQWTFTHGAQKISPVWTRSCPPIDHLISAKGDITALSWVARQSDGRVAWHSVDAARALAPPERPSALAPSEPQHDVILLGAYGVAHYEDFGTSGIRDPLKGSRYLAAAALGCVGALATAYRRTLSAQTVEYVPCQIFVEPRNDFRGAPRRQITPIESTRGWSQAPGNDVLADAQLDAIEQINRHGWQQPESGVSGTRQLLRAPRAARLLTDGGPRWDVHEEKVSFAAPRPAMCDSLEGQAWWPARERLATTEALVTTLARVHASEISTPLQVVQPGWVEQHHIGARPGVTRAVADRRLTPSIHAVPNVWGAVPADVAASLGQQFRAPRPVALPRNAGHVDHDRRPRAGVSHLRTQCCSYYSGSADILDLIADGGLAVVVRLHAPRTAILGPSWDGRIELRFDFRGSEVPSEFALRFCQSVCLTRLRFGTMELRLSARPTVVSPIEQGTVAVEIRVQADELESLRWPTRDEADGELTIELTRDLRACPPHQASDTDDARPREEPFTVLRFPMLLQSARRYPTPLQPCTVMFEDATYNAELGSEVASKEQRDGDLVRRPICTDRRAYHYNGSLTALFSPDIKGNKPTTVTFSRLRLDAGQGRVERRELSCIDLRPGLACGTPADATPSIDDAVFRWELAQLRLGDGGPPALQAHDVLAITLRFESDPEPVELQLPITDDAPIAPPQAAFALWYVLPPPDDQRVRVPLAGWSPMPDRVELVNPLCDLKAGRVRRRALFRWTWVVPTFDQALRPYVFVQKIDHTGASHTPDQVSELVRLELAPKD